MQVVGYKLDAPQIESATVPPMETLLARLRRQRTHEL